MNLSNKIARCAVFGLTLATSAMLMHAQDSKPPEKKSQENRKKADNSAPPQQHNTREQQQHTAPPQPNTTREQQHTAPPQQNTAPPQQHTAPPQQNTMRDQQHTAPPQQHNPQDQQRHDATTPSQLQHTPSVSPPAQTQRPRDAQPNSVPVYRNPQPASGAQPGRTFGNQPGAEPGRTFGRGADPSRGQNPSAPPRTFTNRSGDVIHRDSSGQVQQVHMSNGTVVYHPPNAPRRVEMVRPGGRIVVSSAPGHGYVQRSVVIGNTTVVKRTYIYNGVPQARFYRPRVYNGITLAVYTPVRYYRPTFYAYAYNPWARPISYGWGWTGSPWYGYYGGYFTPYPVYASPSLWLTDFLIAATLESAYQERMAARSAPSIYQDGGYQDSGQSAPMSPEVKQAIADEVRRQIDRERAEGQMANGGGQDSNIFTDNGPHVFVVHASFAVNSNAGECSIGEGDVLQMNGAPPPNSPSADLIVLSSRGRDCRKGSMVSVQLQDLQEMHNQMLATIDRGMSDLQSKQGQGGLPSLPQGSAGTIDSPYAREAQPDANVASELTSVVQEADRAEQQAVSQSGDAGALPPPTLSLGLSIDDVKSIQGEPLKIVDLGSKKIYMYKDLKITFTDGKVTDIQ